MQRKPGFPVANCSIKMPECPVIPDPLVYEDDNEQQQRRQQLINFGHSQWGFNNWSWSVTKQELDFVDFTNGKYCAGVMSLVSITVKSFDIHRANTGYATSIANNKGLAIYKSRKCAVTNALRETLLSFGGSVASELTELLEASRAEGPVTLPEQLPENNQNVANKPVEPRNVTFDRTARKDSVDSGGSPHPALRSPLAPGAAVPHGSAHAAPPAVKNARVLAPSALAPSALPPSALPPANRAAPVRGAAPAAAPVAPPPPPAAPRPNSNDPSKNALDGLSEEEARAERKRRQRLAQEEFRLKQQVKQQGLDDKPELNKNSSFDKLLMDIPTQDIMIEATGEEPAKRKSPAPDTNASASKRRNSGISKLDIVEAD